MKTSRIFKSIAIGIACIALVSCESEKEEENGMQRAFNDQDAVATIEESFLKGNGGEAKEIELLGETLNRSSAMSTSGGGVLSGLQCDLAFDTTLTYNLSGSATGAYTHTWTLLLGCENGIPDNLSINSVYEGFFDGNNIDRSVEGERNWLWTNLNPVFTQRTLNGTTWREGERSSAVGLQNTYNWEISTEFIDIQVNKESHQILSGFATANGLLTSSNGNSFSFDAEIVFNGDGTATVTINGNEYTIEIG